MCLNLNLVPRGQCARVAFRSLGVLCCCACLSSPTLAATGNVNVYGMLLLGGGLSEYDTTLFESGIGAAYAGLAVPNLAFNGAHHRTLLELKTTDGKGCAWSTVDYSQADDAHASLGELGVCKDIGAARIGLGLGWASSTADRRLGGKSTSTVQYLLAELAGAIGHNLEASVTALYGDFETEHRRNYTNGLAVNSSYGQTDASSIALRLRLDWRDSITIGDQPLSPYASYSWYETKQDAYTESGGGLPQSFDAQTWRGRDFRIGATMQTTLSTATTLHIATTAIHVFGEDSVQVTGSGFNIQGERDASNLARLTLDIDHRLSPQAVWSSGIGVTSDFDSGDDWAWSITTGLRTDF